MVLERMATAERPRATDARPDLPPAIDEVLVRALAAERSDRPPSVAVLIEEVERALSDALETKIAAVSRSKPARSEVRASPAEHGTPRGFGAWHFAPAAAALVLFAMIALRATREEPALRPSLEPMAPVISEIVPVVKPIEGPAEPERDEPIAPAIEADRAASDRSAIARVRAKQHPPRRAGPRTFDASPHRALLQKIRERPEDPSAIAALRRLIDRDVERVRDQAVRRRIVRITAVSAMDGDAAGLELAIEELARAAAP
jgi:hypothetical protein